MTGFGTGLVIALSAFLLGVLSMHWTADHLLLWQSPITHQSLLSAHSYYSHTLALRTFTDGLPSHFQRQTLLLHFAWALGSLLVLSKILLGRRQSNWLFDGASFFLYLSCAIVYFSKIQANLSDLPPPTPAPQADPQDPRDPTLLPLRELATSHAVLAAALVGVIVLQSGQYYSQRLEEREEVEEEEARLARRRRRLALLTKSTSTTTSAITTATAITTTAAAAADVRS